MSAEQDGGNGVTQAFVREHGDEVTDDRDRSDREATGRDIRSDRGAQTHRRRSGHSHALGLQEGVTVDTSRQHTGFRSIPALATGRPFGQFFSMDEPTAAYAPPVSQLFSLGKDRPENSAGTDYAALGIGRDDIPALVAMVTDPRLNQSADPQECWAPVHAWRALGELRAVEAIDPLIQLRFELSDDDYIANELPRVMERIGRAAIPSLTDALARPGNVFARASMADAIGRIGATDPEVRDECAAILARQLENFEQQHRALNGLLVSALLDVEAVEHAPVMERALTSGHVDDMIAGDWEDVRIELGLLDARITPKLSMFERLSGRSFEDAVLEAMDRRRAEATSVQEPSAPEHGRSKRERAKEKKKRKLAKAARRRNRR